MIKTFVQYMSKLKRERTIRVYVLFKAIPQWPEVHQVVSFRLMRCVGTQVFSLGSLLFRMLIGYVSKRLKRF